MGTYAIAALVENASKAAMRRWSDADILAGALLSIDGFVLRRGSSTHHKKDEQKKNTGEGFGILSSDA